MLSRVDFAVGMASTHERKFEMATYSELRAQAEELLAQAEKIRQQEKGKVIAELRAKMEEYGIEASDLETGKRGRRPGVGARAKGEPKYRGPNGETWTGGARTQA